MIKVYLFGSKDLFGMPEVIENHMKAILDQTNGEVQFIVGDKGAPAASFQKSLSAIGARTKSLIYSMGEAIHNDFELPVNQFDVSFDESTETVDFLNNNQVVDQLTEIKSELGIPVNRKYYEFVDRMMCRDCDFAICYYRSDDKTAFKIINILKAQNKYVYIYTAA